LHLRIWHISAKICAFHSLLIFIDTELRDAPFRKDHRGLLEKRRFATRMPRRLTFCNVRTYRRADRQYSWIYGRPIARVSSASGIFDTAILVGGSSGR